MVVFWLPASITVPSIVAWKIFRIAPPAHQVSSRYRSIRGPLLQNLAKNFRDEYATLSWLASGVS
jgi:predicted MarR family transcription regulator